MTPKEIIVQLRQMMHKEGWDALVISGTDPHSSEYLPKRWQVRKYVSGFTGSYGTVVITAEHAGLWTDTRYFIQANTQLEGTGITLHKKCEIETKNRHKNFFVYLLIFYKKLLTLTV